MPAKRFNCYEALALRYTIIQQPCPKTSESAMILTYLQLAYCEAALCQDYGSVFLGLWKQVQMFALLFFKAFFLLT